MNNKDKTPPLRNKTTNPTTNKNNVSIPDEPKNKMVVTKNGIVEVEVKKVLKKEKTDNRKYVKLSEKDPKEKIKEITDRVTKKEIKWAYYGTENFIGVQYYVIL